MIVVNGTEIKGVYRNGSQCSVYFNCVKVFPDDTPAPPSTIPAGIVMPFAGSIAPVGFLLCDGSEVSRSIYAELFDVIGVLYGAGDGSTTFNLPDLAGRVAIGPSEGNVLASTGGEASHTLLVSELPSHEHEVPQHGHSNNITATTPQLSHTITQPVFKYNKPTQKNSGGSGTTVIGSVTTATGSRSANVVIADHDATACTMTGSIEACDAITSTSVGGGEAHNNMQPYVVSNFIISIGG